MSVSSSPQNLAPSPIRQNSAPSSSAGRHAHFEAPHFRVHALPPYLLEGIAQEVLAQRLAGKDVIDLSKVNPNQGPPTEAVDTLVQAVLRPENHRYSSSQGILKLRQTMAELYQTRYEISVDADAEVIVTFGTKEGLGHLLMAMLSPGDTVLVPTPRYPVYGAQITLAGGSLLAVPLPSPLDLPAGVMTDGASCVASEKFFTDLEHALRVSWPTPRAMILGFPHNPTGIVVDRSFFDRLVNFAREEGLFLIHDFSYAGVGFDGYVPPSILESPGAMECAVELTSLSKSFGMPGWRVGCAAGNVHLVSALKRLKGYLDFGVFQPLQIGAVRALRRSLERDGQLEMEFSQTIESRRNMLLDGLTALGWEVAPPRGGVFLWAKLPESCRGEGSLAFARRLLEGAAVAVCPGEAFDPEQHHWIRFALVENEGTLREVIRRLGTV